MQTYVSFLRGINVTGHNMIKMASLKDLYESLGLNDVVTYIQSGNVVFRSRSKDAAALAHSIMKAIEKKFGFSVAVVMRRPEELARVVRRSPFTPVDGIDESRLYVTFLNTKPAPALVKNLSSAAAKSDDQYHVIGREVFLHCPNGYGKSLLSNTFFEKQLKVEATTRNWKTVQTLLELSRTSGAD